MTSGSVRRHAASLLLWLAALAASVADQGGDLLKAARAAAGERKFDEALRLYERLIVDDPRVMTYWSAAQGGIADTLARKGDFDGALKAAHICFDTASDGRALGDVIGLIARIISARDKGVGCANAFIDFQNNGPGGGRTNELANFGYPAQPERERSFAEARREATPDAAGARYRAFTYLYTGKPREALAHFADAFRRSSDGSDIVRAGQDLVMYGLRAVRIHSVGLDNDMLFVRYGPNGPDGQPKTSDDMTDPFAAWLPPAPPPGEGGLAGLGADELSALRYVRDAALLYGGDPQQRGTLRRPALMALQRANDILDGWGTPGQKDWYMAHAFDAVNLHPAEIAVNEFFRGAGAAARGRDLHLGGTHQAWSELSAQCAVYGIKVPHGHGMGYQRYGTVGAAFEKARFGATTLRPMKSAATF